jgi:hypothetical protein
VPSGGETLYSTLIGRDPLLHLVFCSAEISLGCWLISGWNVPWSSGVACIVFAFFTGTITFEIFRDNPLPCGCGLVVYRENLAIVRRVLGTSLAVNALLLGATGWILWDSIKARNYNAPLTTSEKA